MSWTIDTGKIRQVDYLSHCDGWLCVDTGVVLPFAIHVYPDRRTAEIEVLKKVICAQREIAAAAAEELHRSERLLRDLLTS